MNLKAISRNVGFALLVSALFMFLSIIVSMLNGNDSALAALLISFTITFTVGIFPFIFVSRAPVISLTDGYMIIVLSWLLSFIFGMLPYILWGGPFTVANAWFESVSGFTTTGATILDNVEQLPKSLLFWRASTHYIGGLGIVVFLLLIIPLSAPVKLRLTNMELSSLSKQGYKTRANKTVYIFTNVYLALTAISFICYLLAGMPAFDALCHSFSVVSTGGFSSRNLSIASFNSVAIDLITLVFMFVASMHFGLIYVSLASRSFKTLNNPVLKLYFFTTLFCSLGVSLSIAKSGDMKLGQALLEGTFHTVSYSSTTGFSIGDTSSYPMFATLILIWCSIQCGMAGSTTGGVKSDRILILFKAIARHVKKAIHPSTVKQVKIGKNALRDEELYQHVLFVALYACMILFCSLLNIIISPGTEDVVANTVCCLGNVGLTVGDIGSLGNFNSQTFASKMLYTLEMLLGRLEFYPVFAVITMLLRKER